MTLAPSVLGVDFGTSHTVAALTRDDGRIEPLLFDSSPLLPSAVFADTTGYLLVGRDAERSARADPARYEPHPKRRIDDGVLLLGEQEVSVADAITAVLRRVWAEALRLLGRPPRRVVLTHPAGWGPQRRGLLAAAATVAGMPGADLVPEPVAAATYFTGVLDNRVPAGRAVVVYDLGGGTFDVSVVLREPDGGWRVAAADGLDVGGLDLDAAVVAWAGDTIAPADRELWERVLHPRTPVDRRHRRHLWDDARAAKEQLTRTTSAAIALPLVDLDVHLTRDEFEAMARPTLDRTVTLTTRTLTVAGVAPDRIAGLFLVGGSSRIPLIATMLHRALRVAPVVTEQPELVVAHGSLAAAPAPVSVPASPPEAPTEPVRASPQEPSTRAEPAAPDPAPAAAPRPETEATTPFPAGFSRIMDDFFGPRRTGPVRLAPDNPAGAPRQPYDGRDLETDLKLSRRAAADGGVFHLELPVPGACPDCAGRGRRHLGRRCATCDGSGVKLDTGSQTRKVRLPAGSPDGRRVRLAGLGEPATGGAGRPGDLYVRLLVDPDDRLRREG